MAICDGRLLSTAWLNQFGQQEPDAPDADYSYETPQLTADEAQFPEFFRVQIEVGHR
jgi:hypothetical protein